MVVFMIGYKQIDYLWIMYLFEIVIDFVWCNFVFGGFFLVKVFCGGIENEMLWDLKCEFKFVVYLKLLVSCKESLEFYVIVKGFRGSDLELDV